MKKIEILITPDGKTSIQTLGFTGSSCRDASRFLEQALGQRLQENLTAEFHQTQTADEHHQQRQS